MQDSSAVQHSVDSLTGQSATPCRSARPHRYPDAGRQTASGLESAVELRLGEKSARQSQNLVGFAQFSNFTLQRFYPVALGAGNPIAHANVDLVLTDPIMQGLGEHNRSWAQWIQRLPTRTDTRHGVRTPCVPLVHVLRGKTCLISSWLHSLRCWSLLETRGGSNRLSDDCRGGSRPDSSDTESGASELLLTRP